MSQETLQPNPVTDEAVNLRQADVAASEALRKHDAFSARRKSNAPLSIEGVIGGPMLDLQEGVKSMYLGVKKVRAARAAKKHYQQNEATYQDQAVADAKAEDVDLDGWDQK